MTKVLHKTWVVEQLESNPPMHLEDLMTKLYKQLHSELNRWLKDMEGLGYIVKDGNELMHTSKPFTEFVREINGKASTQTDSTQS